MDTGRQRPRVVKQGLMLLGGQCGDLDLRLWACGIVLGGKVGHMQRSCNHLIAVSLSFCTPPPLKKKMFWPCPTAYGNLVPRSGIKLMPSALEAWSFKLLDHQGNPSVSLFVRWR